MKRQFFTLLTTGIFYASLTASAFAGAPTADTAKDKLVSQLERREHQLEWEAQDQKGVPRVQLEQQSLQVKKLIERVKAGEAVDPQAINKLLK